jgi:hypothetical protein
MTEVGDNLFTKPTISRNGEKWEQSRIMNETPGCWVLDNGDKPNKKTLITAKDRMGYATRYYTAAGMKAKQFCDKHARDIAAAVSVCDDQAKLIAIAMLIGKELKL